MTCRDAIDLIADYLDHELPEDAGRTLEGHLDGCEPCRAYLATYRSTRQLISRAGRVEMPEELKARLRRFLLAQLGG